MSMNDSSKLELFHDWKICNACGLPPQPAQPKPEDCTTSNTVTDSSTDIPSSTTTTTTTTTLTRMKLLTCRNCKTRAYHNVTCQKNDWKRHKVECQYFSTALKPLLQLLEIHSTQQQQQSSSSSSSTSPFLFHDNYDNGWFHQISKIQVMDSNDQWESSVQLWCQQQDYLNAMEGFQQALEPYGRAWNKYNINKNNNINKQKHQQPQHNENQYTSISLNTTYTNTNTNSPISHQQALMLAKRLLFCAYCEMDGQQISNGRLKLVQCISILLYLLPTMSSSSSSSFSPLSTIWTETLNDAWMELMLSMEEESSLTRPIAVHVANLAITSGGPCCSWTDPMQRPGYMAPIISIINQNNDNNDNHNHYYDNACFTPREYQPSWCQILEYHWETILQEYLTLRKDRPHFWSRVGSGERGSGQDDHRVVSGQDWTEYVLFGTKNSHHHDINYMNHNKNKNNYNNNNNDNDAPFTKQLLLQHIPEAVHLAEMGGGEVIFSRLAPHTHIGAHCGPTNLRKTAHLGLVIPNSTTTAAAAAAAANSNNDADNNITMNNPATSTTKVIIKDDTKRQQQQCQIRVGQEWHSWEAGKVLYFDDSFEHEVRNDTNEERVVLLIRTWHPNILPNDRERFLYSARSAKENAVEKRFHPPN